MGRAGCVPHLGGVEHILWGRVRRGDVPSMEQHTDFERPERAQVVRSVQSSSDHRVRSLQFCHQSLQFNHDCVRIPPKWGRGPLFIRAHIQDVPLYSRVRLLRDRM